MKKTDSTHTDLIIAGGGPAGLFLAGLMLQKGRTVTVLEKRKTVDRHSRALGIHPVSLELFRDAEIDEPFTSQGIKIKRGAAYIDRKKIGEISFEHCPKPFNYILALPQHRTETILENWVSSLNPGALIRGAEVNEIKHTPDGIFVRAEHEGELKDFRGTFLAGCDGKNSFVRKEAGIEFEGRPYPDTYVMGDFEDNTTHGPDAAVYLHRKGLIESFPLPDGKRRWVVKTDHFIENPSSSEIENRVTERIGHSLSGLSNEMISSFGVQHLLAKTFHKKRIIIAGDAAHVVSPIGGQGMNLGWLNVQLLSTQLEQALNDPEMTEPLIRQYTQTALKTAGKTARRAEMNMRLGRARNFTFPRNLAARLIVQTPLKKIAAKVFTMR